jgi:hypothetical protein
LIFIKQQNKAQYSRPDMDMDKPPMQPAALEEGDGAVRRRRT